jgi:UDP-N-acetylglucosamine:LPS N-acetylglucosamine transferase
VCRAGASTLAELTVAGLPALLVPLPIATEDHQAKGAAAMAEAGAALWARDEDLTVDWLAEQAGALLAEPARLDAMSEAARRLGRPDAAARVAALVEEHARA